MENVHGLGTVAQQVAMQAQGMASYVIYVLWNGFQFSIVSKFSASHPESFLRSSFRTHFQKALMT